MCRSMPSKPLLLCLLALSCSGACADWKCTNDEGNEFVTTQKPLKDKCEQISEGKEEAKPEKKYVSNPKDRKKAIENSKAAILSTLKDPRSAVFRNIIVRNDFYVCGEMNAKNSFGGYVGFKKFINTGGIATLTSWEEDSVEFMIEWAKSCLGATEEQIAKARGR